AGLVLSGETYFFQIRSTGGAAEDVPADATAYAHRSARFSVVAMGASRSRLDARWDALADVFDGMYLSFDTDRRPETHAARLADAFPPATLDRLREIKRRVDPANVFRDNLPVLGPDPVDAEAADRKSARLNSSHVKISYAVFCLKKKSTHAVTATRRHT